MRDELRDHRIVVDRDLAALLDAVITTYLRSVTYCNLPVTYL